VCIAAYSFKPYNADVSAQSTHVLLITFSPASSFPGADLTPPVKQDAMRRRRSSLLPFFVLLVLALSQVGTAAGHGGVLDRAHSNGKGRRWRKEDSVGRGQLAAGVDGAHPPLQQARES